MKTTIDKLETVYKEDRVMKVFFLDDDLVFSELMKCYLAENIKANITFYQTGTEFLNDLSLNPDIIILDYNLPDYNGEKLLKKVKAFNPNTPVIFVSGQNEVAKAIELFKLGADDYIVKDDYVKDHLLKSLNKAAEKLKLVGQIESLNDLLKNNFSLNKALIGNHSSIKKNIELISKIEPTNLSVAIIGEIGTGKDTVAKMIHYQSKRAKQNLITFNASVVAKNQHKIELFGEEYITALGTKIKNGLLHKAQDGTLIISEPAEIPKDVQAELVQAFKTGEYSRINSDEKIPLDIRFIITSNTPLQELLSEGKLLSEFYYRFSTSFIHLPQLANRGNDIILIAQKIVEDYSNENQTKPVKLSEKAIKKLMQYSYPGNIHELKSTIELAIATCSGNKIEEDDIVFTPVSINHNLLMDEKTLEDYNQIIISHFMTKYNNNTNLVADKLAIGRSTIYAMIKAGRIKI